MASSLNDPELAHSLWLQVRSTRRKSCRTQWRSDWTPIWILLLLMSILTFFSVIMPSNDAIEKAKEADQIGTEGRQPPVVGALAEP